MSPILFYFILYICYFKTVPIICQEEYNEKYYADHVSHYFDINEIVNFTEYLVFNITDYVDYNKKLNSALLRAAHTELSEDLAQDNKGYVDTAQLLDDMPNSSNTTIYHYSHTITLLFNQVFFRQKLYHVHNMCKYIGNISNHINDGLMKIYNPDEWIKRLNDLDKLYLIEQLPEHFAYVVRTMTNEDLLYINVDCDQQLAYNIQLLQLYQYLAEIERERFIMTAAAYQVKYGCHQSNGTDILYDLQKSLILRTQSYITTAKQLMKISPREIRQCDLEMNNQSNYIKADEYHHMSLRPVVSDIDQNEIVTAVSFASKKNFIYPRIQTSILSSMGYVRQKKLAFRFHWEEAADEENSTYGVDYISFNSNQSQIQRINLNDIYVDDGYVVTGVKFSIMPNIVGEDIADGSAGVTIGLEVRATKFNFETGKLGESKWIFGKSPTAQRPGIILNNQSNLLILHENFSDTVSGHYVKFEKSQSTEAGENVIVPFFDGRSHTIVYTYPLGGISLYYHDKPKFKGYISFKLISYDPSIYMNENISSTFGLDRVNI